jgi:hypothetical protein
MKRIVLMITLASVVALMMALSGPAWATIHPLANSECASDNASSVANDQLPPGLSPYPETSILEKMSWAQAR